MATENIHVKLPFCGATWEAVLMKLEELKSPLESSEELATKLGQLWAALTDQPEEEEANIADTPYKGLLAFIDSHLEETERTKLLTDTLPFIAQAATCCEELTPEGGLPIMTQGGSTTCRQLVLTRRFICSLVACSFLSLCPVNREIPHLSMPSVNFFEWFGYIKNLPSQRAKTKCLLNYFHRSKHGWEEEKKKETKNSILFTRITVKEEERLTWERLLTSEDKLCDISVVHEERIEDSGPGSLQVDFANEFIGGGVLGAGRVQEEIRFCLSPELMAAMFFQESLTEDEAILIEGFEQYSDYTGYANSLTFKGNFNDPAVSQDSFNPSIMNTALVAIDAIPFTFSVRAQFTQSAMLREINKAYCGFSQPTSCGSQLEEENIIKTSECMRPLVTGNWGCGAFGGSPQLKAMLQWLAASVRGSPSLKYCTFSEERVKGLGKVCGEVREQGWTVKDLAGVLTLYCEKMEDEMWERKSLFQFIRDNVNIAL